MGGVILRSKVTLEAEFFIKMKGRNLRDTDIVHGTLITLGECIRFDKALLGEMDGYYPVRVHPLHYQYCVCDSFPTKKGQDSIRESEMAGDWISFLFLRKISTPIFTL
jgi:hypothetical protein